MAAAEERTKRRRRGLLAGVRARQWVSAPPSSSPWMAPCFRARARAPRRPGGERRSVLSRAPTKRAARVCPARWRPAVGRCRSVPTALCSRVRVCCSI